MIGRDRSKGEAAAAEIRARSSNEAVELMVADLSRRPRSTVWQGVRGQPRPARRARKQRGRMYARRWETADGIEGTLAVIHLAPVLLTSLLSRCSNGALRRAS